MSNDGKVRILFLAEDQFKNPFDVSHIVLHRYKHLGEDIGVAEAEFRGRKIKALRLGDGPRPR